MKKILREQFENFGYTVEEDLNSIQVRIVKNLYADIKFKDDGKVQISELFKGWSLLFGFAGFSFKGNFNIYSGLFLLIISLIFVFDLDDILLSSLIGFIGLFLINLFSFIYYLIKYENFKYFAFNQIEKISDIAKHTDK